MNVQEFSDSFDTLLNSYSNQAQFGEESSKQDITLDEYEKSALLTQAQDIILKSYFDRRLNASGEGFDDSTRRQIDFSSLIKTTTLSKATDQSAAFDDRGIIYNLPTDVLFILNEQLKTSSKNYVIVPINYKEYDREMTKAYAQPLKKQVWRLFQNNTQGFDVQSELIPRWDLEANETISAYKIRYVRRPCPIVLVDLPEELEIDGYTEVQECELNPILHPEILQKAVEIAIATRGGASSYKSNNEAK